MKLLFLLITTALLGCSLASPLEQQELVDEVLEALTQESNERELADVESNQLVDAESDDELADMEDDGEELEDEAEEQDVDSVLEALAQVMDLEELADIESEDELTEIEDDDAMETEDEEATVEFNLGKYYKKAKKIVRKLKKYKKYYVCVKDVSSSNTSKAVNCVMKKMGQGKKSSSKRTRKPTFLEGITDQVNLQDFIA